MIDHVVKMFTTSIIYLSNHMHSNSEATNLLTEADRVLDELAYLKLITTGAPDELLLKEIKRMVQMKFPANETSRGVGSKIFYLTKKNETLINELLNDILDSYDKRYIRGIQ
jgi:hypothetical protein